MNIFEKMTEIERIIKKGIFSESFFKPELICDFQVDSTRKKVWAIEIDLLLEIDRVCKKYGLRYFLAFGSLLGAVRHHGFIPWDDDMDIVMPREDYQELWMHAEEFKEPYFFQTPLSDPSFCFAHARLRNSNTCAIQRPFCDCKYNMGMFIDILPLDAISKDERGMDIFNKLQKLLIDSSTSMKAYTKCLNERDKTRVLNLTPVNPVFRFEKIQQLAQTFDLEKEEYVFQSMALVYGFDRSVLKKEDFSKSIDMNFEGYSFPIPVGYDDILKTIYGNYQDFPPVEKRGVWHGEVWFDMEKSYLAVKQEKEYNIWANTIY